MNNNKFNKTPLSSGLDGTLRLGTKNDSITFLGSLEERSAMPSVWNKMEVFVHHFEGGDGQCELVKSGKEWMVTYVQLPNRIR